MAPIIVLIALILLIVFFVFYKRPKKKVFLPENFREILTKNVSYYHKLDEKNKEKFEEKIKDFLSYVRIDGIDTTVEDIDRLLVASAAVIPIFGFKKWKYNNLRNVLLYPASFNREEFLASGYEKNTLGMIGNGPMQRVMILSKPALRGGFMNKESRANTGIHEFVHLLDKEDGEVDGLPEVLLNRKYNSKWIEQMNKNIGMILQENSDISHYGATNKAEFFAVTSEYFFNLPELFKENHPELFELMGLIFNQDPTNL
ncbi:MAG: zinc-dependent peptidase [Bacteroidota bacterium]|nr:zinc-dependent peptidase [Bacteroidota bacterium]